MGKQGVSAIPLVPPSPPDQHAGHVNPGHAGRERGTAHAHGGKAELAVNQRPIAEPVDEIGRDERKRHRPDFADTLQITPEGDVDEQWERTEIEQLNILPGRCAHRSVMPMRGNRCGAKPTTSMAKGV